MNSIRVSADNLEQNTLLIDNNEWGLQEDFVTAVPVVINWTPGEEVDGLSEPSNDVNLSVPYWKRSN